MLKALLFFILFLFVITTPKSLWADEYLELSEVGYAKHQDPFQARKVIQDEVIEKVSLRYITDLIGDKKVNKNKNMINAKIIKNYGRYIPTVKVGRLEGNGDSRQMTVTLKISLQNLKQMLLQNGLLYEQDGPAVVLPMIAMTDKTHMLTYRWWVSDNDKSKNFLHQEISGVHNELTKALKNQGFFLRNPTAANDKNLVPQAYQIDALRLEDLFFLGEFFKSQIVVKGDIRFEQGSEGSEVSRIYVRMTAMHTGNGRVVAEVVRALDTEPGVFERTISNKLDTTLPDIANDLATQMHEAWQKGTFGTRLIKLTLRGPLDYYQVNKFKTQVEQKVGEIKSIRERLFEPSQVTFEVDSSVGIDGLVEKFKKSRFDGFNVELDGVSAEVVALRLDFENKP
ncbi:MAG: hypothetical protein A4S09_15120 [Proteobacteria bacterium SG_bin7]|nr:MAG: hypothetical protein A4S09_15120 [Proteobacteria bacterium SG_bin7]